MVEYSANWNKFVGCKCTINHGGTTKHTSVFEILMSGLSKITEEILFGDVSEIHLFFANVTGLYNAWLNRDADYLSYITFIYPEESGN